jgi:hypothetical protein
MNSIYAPPSSDIKGPQRTELEQLRAAHLDVEGRILEVGRLSRALGLIGFIWALTSIGNRLAIHGAPDSILWALRGGTALMGGALMMWGGHQLVHLRAPGRLPTLIGLGLNILGGSYLSIPLLAYGLWATVPEKAAVVLGPDYAAVREATPHIQQGTSRLVLLLSLLLLIVVVGAGLIGLHW